MNNKALVVVDVQNALVMAQPYNIQETIRNIATLLSTCRENNVEVIYVQHSEGKGEELEPYTEAWQIYKDIFPKEDEEVIQKSYNSAFKETNLKELLDKKGIEELIITGMQTEYCIDATCKVAFEYGYKVIIPENTNTTFDNSIMSAKDTYNYYNFMIFKDRFGTIEELEDTIERIRTKHE